MKQAEHLEAFEQVLLSHTEMCFSVALALTRNLDQAQDLTRNVLLWAWHLRGSAAADKDIKKKLLIALRKTFLKDYRQSRCGFENEAMRGENRISFAQDA